MFWHLGTTVNCQRGWHLYQGKIITVEPWLNPGITVDYCGEIGFAYSYCIPMQRILRQVKIGNVQSTRGSGVVLRVSDLRSKSPGFDPQAVPPVDGGTGVLLPENF